MNFTKFVVALVLVTSAFSTPSQSSEINLEAFLNGKLANLRDYKLSESCSFTCDLPGVVSGGKCIPFFVNPDLTSGDPKKILDYNNAVDDSMNSLLQSLPNRKSGCCKGSTSCTPVNGKLKVQGTPSFSHAAFKFDEPVYNSTPLSAEVVKVRWRNCTKVSQGLSRTLTLQSSQRDTISTTQTVGKSTSTRVDARFQFKWAGIGGSVGAAYTVNRSHSLSEGSSTSSSQTVTRSTTVRFTIPPKSEFVAEAVIYDLEAYVPFKISGRADSSISRNLENIRMASQVLNANTRSFNLKGRIDAVGVSEMDIATYSSEIDCTGQSALTVEESKFGLAGYQLPEVQAQTKKFEGYADKLYDILDPEDPICLASNRCGVGSTCSATNDNLDAECSISCQVGESAVCIDAAGSGTPTCECQ